MRAVLVVDVDDWAEGTHIDETGVPKVMDTLRDALGEADLPVVRGFYVAIRDDAEKVMAVFTPPIKEDHGAQPDV